MNYPEDFVDKVMCGDCLDVLSKNQNCSGRKCGIVCWFIGWVKS
jgi:hypothetical protein